MRSLIVWAGALAATCAFADVGTVRIASFKEVISPEVGAKIC